MIIQPWLVVDQSVHVCICNVGYCTIKDSYIAHLSSYIEGCTHVKASGLYNNGEITYSVSFFDEITFIKVVKDSRSLAKWPIIEH